MNRFVRPYKRKFPKAPVKTGPKLAKRQVQEVKTLIAKRQELKYYYTTTNPPYQDASNTGGYNLGSLTLVPQGDGDSTRDGDRLQFCGTAEIRVSTYIQPYNSGSPSWCRIRYIVWQWHPSSIPTVGNILLNDFRGYPGVYSQYYHDTRQQYKILVDKTWTLTGSGTGASVITSSSAKEQIFRIPSSKFSKFVQFVNATTVGTNLIYHMIMSDTTTATYPQYGISTKFFYRDS